MKQLLLLRHAKSDWNADFSHDWDRPLNRRGKDDAKLLGQWMAEQNLAPELVLCSPAVRTRMTLDLVLKTLGVPGIKIQYLDSLYLADLKALLETIHKIPQSTNRVLLVGHNPGLDNLLVHLVQQEPPYTVKGKLLTTANLAVIELAEEFNNVTSHSAELLSLIRPKEIGTQLDLC